MKSHLYKLGSVRIFLLINHHLHQHIHRIHPIPERLSFSVSINVCNYSPSPEPSVSKSALRKFVYLHNEQIKDLYAQLAGKNIELTLPAPIDPNILLEDVAEVDEGEVDAQNAVGQGDEVEAADQDAHSKQMTNTDTDMSEEEDPQVCHQIQEILSGYSYGLPVSSCLSSLQKSYEEKFNKPLDFESLGVNCIEDLLCLMRDKITMVPISKETYVFYAPMVEWRQGPVLYPRVQELLNNHCGEILFSDFEGQYEHKFKEKLDYQWHGLTDLDHLCVVLNDILFVEVNSSGENVIKAFHKYTRVLPLLPPLGFPEVCQQIQWMLGNYPFGLPLSCLESVYQENFIRSLDCKSFGANSIEDLLYKMMPDKVMVYVEPLTKMKHAQSVLVLEMRQKTFLKDSVKGLLDKHCGEILFSSFDDLYNREYKMELEYQYYGLTNLDHLCDVLKDILVVEVNSSGEKVIKAVRREEMNGKIEGCRRR